MSTFENKREHWKFWLSYSMTGGNTVCTQHCAWRCQCNSATLRPQQGSESNALWNNFSPPYLRDHHFDVSFRLIPLRYIYFRPRNRLLLDCGWIIYKLYQNTNLNVEYKKSNEMKNVQHKIAKLNFGGYLTP
jgi:hypothetical protein